MYLTGAGPGFGKGEDRRTTREAEARAFGDYFRFDQARQLLGDTGPERPVVAPDRPLSFNGFAPDFVYRSIPAPDLTIEQVVGLGVAYAHEAMKAHRNPFVGLLP
ncbi:hypothetical protein ACIRVK_40750 [Streptomyces sp. NPDC101152]|uniref:hypothetical protein n=1 Tax=Streptomyces sp. NPDC101152 TaxID=3366116 RepID=UPI00380F93DA